MSMQTKTIGRMPTDHGPYDPQLAYGKKFQCTLFGCAWESLHDNNNTAPAVWDGGDIITPNLVDWKKVSGSYEAWLMNKDKPATTGTTGAYPYNGKGRVVLKKNIVNGVNTLTHEAFEDSEGNDRENTIYVIQYDFTLGEDITVPANCVLEFEGGSISGTYTMTGTNTCIVAEQVQIFHHGVTITGTWNVKDIFDAWFDNQTNDIKNVFAISNDAVYNKINISKNHSVEAVGEHDYVLAVKSNTDVVIIGNITMQGNDFEDYSIFGVHNSKNVNIVGQGGSLSGDLDLHTGSTGEWGHGIKIGNSRFVTIKNLEIQKCWGDGIMIGDTVISSNIIIDSCNIHNCRRQGVSITYANQCDIINCEIYNIDGHSPSACIDLEPVNLGGNYGWQTVENINIINCTLHNSSYGLLFTVTNENYENLKDIKIEDCNLYGNSIWQINSFCPSKIEFSRCKIEGDNCIRLVKAESVVFKDCSISCKYLDINRSYVNELYKVLIDNCLIVSTGTYHDNKHDTVIYAATISNSSLYGFMRLYIVKSINNVYNLNTCGDGAYYIELVLFDSFNDEFMYEGKDICYAMIHPDNIVLKDVSIKKGTDSDITIPNALCYVGSGTRCLIKGSFDTELRNIKMDPYNQYSAKVWLFPEENVKYSGTTSERPSDLGLIDVGFRYTDTTLGKPIFWMGSGWVDATGTPV